MCSETLILVHSLVRHGDRTQDPATFYPNDPQKNNTYYPNGLGMLTNEGKRTMYTTGQAFRKRYNDFLGDIYVSKDLSTWTTEYERCKASAQILLAALYPPRNGQKWSDHLDWQPIPTNYMPAATDELLCSVATSKSFMKAYLAQFESDHVKEFLKKHEYMTSYIEKHSGLKINNTRDFLSLHDGIKSQKENGLPQPEWILSIFPEKLAELAYKDYEMQACTKELKRIVSGQLLKKILSDTQEKIKGNSKCKMHLYVAHDLNVANMLVVLGLSRIYKPYPQYGAAITFEVHRIDGTYGFKIFYKKDKAADFELLTLSDGKTIWWIEEFEKFVDDLCSDDDITEQTDIINKFQSDLTVKL